MKGLIGLSVGRPVGVSIVFLAVAMFGLVALRQLAVDLLPSVDVPMITVTTRYEGVAPAEIETLLTRPIERATSTIEGVERIEAESSEGLSRVRLQFAWGTPLDNALDDVRVALDRVRAQLPEDADPPSVYKFDLASVPIAALGLTGTGSPRQLKHLAEDDLSRALERVEGVASVDVQGGVDREIRVALDSARLEALAISAEQVAAALAKENRTVSAGDMRAAGREVVIRTEGELVSAEDIGAVVVTTRDGSPVLVRDLGAVLDTIREVRSNLYIDGEPGIRLRVYKQAGVNTVEVAARVRQQLERLNQTYGERAQLTMLWDSSDFIRAAVTNVEKSAWVGALLAGIILLVFLRSVRATLMVATAIPLSVIATFALMHFSGMTLNIISFGGIALGIGMLVDGAIVILENIYRRRDEGLTAEQAAREGASEMAAPVTAGTLTTMAVFVPVVFVGDLAGVLFGEMAMVVTFALLCSLAVALTLVPMMSARLLAGGGEQRRGRLDRAIGGMLGRLDNAYAEVLRQLLGAPWAVVVGAIALLASSILLTPRLDVELMPESDEGQLEIDIELAVGTPLETTDEVIRDMERKALASLMPGELEHVITSVGPEAWWRPGGSHEGEVELTLVPVGERERSVTEIQAGVRKALADIPGVDLRIRPTSSNILTRIIRRGEDRLAVEIRGHDLEVVDRLTSQVIPIMMDVDGITHAHASREMGKLERVLKVDRERAAELGLGSAEIAATVEHYILGRVATRLRDDGDEYDIRVQLAGMDRERLELLPSLPVVTPTGQRVPLSSLVTIEEARGPSSIQRVDQERVLRIEAGTGDRPLADMTRDLRERLRELPVPEGFQILVTGELDEQGDAFASLLIGILLACFLVFATMAVQFESLRQPLIVMASVPFAFIGVILALLVTGTTFSMNAFLGTIVLVGIVVNNAIVLVDTANTLRDEGWDVETALCEAARRRLRPILMTTLTTVLGLVPLAIGGGEGGEMQTPLARTVIGGLTTSTLVTLVLIPCLYLLTAGRRKVPEQAGEGEMASEVPNAAE